MSLIYTLQLNYLLNDIKKTRYFPIKYIIKNNCWECISHKTNKGYPRFRYKGKQYQIYRFIYEYLNDKIPKNKVIRHKCHNKLCINPKHLILGTIQDNINDTVKANRQAKGEKIGISKLTKHHVRYILNSQKSGNSISKELNVSASTINRIRQGKTWRHIK